MTTMKTNLGQLLVAVDTLDRAAAVAPLTRADHAAAQNCVALLRNALPELWAALSSQPGGVTAPSEPPQPNAAS